MSPGDEERVEAEEKIGRHGESVERLGFGGGFTYAQGQKGECSDSGERTTTRSLSDSPVEDIDGQDIVTCAPTYRPHFNLCT